jgi:dienelactone hydrolase
MTSSLQRTTRHVGAVAFALLVLPSPGLSQGRDLPTPSGSRAVGLVTAGLTDRTRREELTTDSSDSREVVVDLWYPARSRMGPRAPYILDSTSARDMFSNQSLQKLAATRAHAIRGAAPQSGRALPLVLISPGAGVSPSNYTAIAEDLASHGYVVAALAHPYESPMVRLHDGRVAVANNPRPDENFFDVAKRSVMRRAADLRFVLTYLVDSASRIVPGLRIDARRAVVMGHSRGGVAALEACKRDNRFRACVNIDGGVLGGPYYEDSTGAGPRAPTMWLQAFHPSPSDSLLATWKMSRAQWDSFDIRANHMLARSRGGAWRVTIPDTAHMAFTDLKLLLGDSAQAKTARVTLSAIREILLKFVETSSRGPMHEFQRLHLDRSRGIVLRIPESKS